MENKQERERSTCMPPHILEQLLLEQSVGEREENVEGVRERDEKC